MAVTDQGGETENSQVDGETLSQFLARILGQLAPTAWLPAMTLVAVGLVLAEMYWGKGSVTRAFTSIGDLGFASLAILIGLVIVVAIFTQAFEFEAIRALEGYWPTTGPFGHLTRWRCSCHRRRKDGLEKQMRDARLAAAQSTRNSIFESELHPRIYKALIALIVIELPPPGTTARQLAKAESLLDNWKSIANPDLVQQYEGLCSRLNEFPESAYRILPTRIGNVMRAVEDQIHDASQGRLENYALHDFDRLPIAIAQNFRKERRNLDLYCGLVFVLSAALIPSIVVGWLYPHYNTSSIVVPATVLLLAYISYRAALASSRRFVVALLSISEERRLQQTSPDYAERGPSAIDP